MIKPPSSMIQPGQVVVIRVGNLAGIPASVVSRQDDRWLIVLSSFGPGVYALVNDSAVGHVSRD